MSKLQNFLGEHWRGLIASAIGMAATGILGVVAANYSAYYSARLNEITEYSSRIDASQNELDALFRKFFAIAAGEKPNSPDEIDKLAQQLLAFKGSAYNIVMRTPAVGPEYEALEDRMVALVQAAAELSPDATENKPFVSAVAEFAVAADAFKKAVADQQGKFRPL